VNSVNGAALVRREAMLEVGGYDETMVHGCEDWDLWLTMVERGFTGAIIPEVLFFYRRRADSMSRDMSKGDRPVELLETLVRKHEASYRRHIGSLVAAREREVETARREVQKHRLEQVTTLLPQVARSRHRLAAVRDKAERVRLQLERTAELRNLREAVAAERSRVTTVETEASSLRGADARLREENARLHRDIADIRASLTWRLTGPARAIVGWLRRPGGS
jgi:hypothetical protein